MWVVKVSMFHDATKFLYTICENYAQAYEMESYYIKRGSERTVEIEPVLDYTYWKSLVDQVEQDNAVEGGE